MSHSPRLENLKVANVPLRRVIWLAWREWCFARCIARRLLGRGVLLVILVVIGGSLFRAFSDKSMSFIEAMYATWSLIFAQPPGPFPAHPILRAMYFAVPILGLTVVIETIVGMAIMIRDRRSSERSWCKVMAHSYTDHVVIVGLGRLGFSTFKLLRRLGERLVVIECNPQNQFLEDVRRDGSPLLVGDARQDQILLDANVAGAKAIIVATDNDLANLEVALDARRMSPRIHVVLRMFDQNMADKVSKGFNIHMAMSQSAISAPAFATAAVEPSMISGAVVDDQLVVMQRWIVRAGGLIAGRTVAEVLAQQRISVVEHRRKGTPPTLFPPPDTRLDADDEVVVQGPYDTLQDLCDRAGIPIRPSGRGKDGPTPAAIAS